MNNWIPMHRVKTGVRYIAARRTDKQTLLDVVTIDANGVIHGWTHSKMPTAFYPAELIPEPPLEKEAAK